MSNRKDSRKIFGYYSFFLHFSDQDLLSWNYQEPHASTFSVFYIILRQNAAVRGSNVLVKPDARLLADSAVSNTLEMYFLVSQRMLK
jgi:hypothetical protein